jgi:hypothetical protein
VRQIGTTLGVALSGMIAGATAKSAVFAGSTRPFWWLAVAGGIVIAALGVIATGAFARRSVPVIRSLAD